MQTMPSTYAGTALLLLLAAGSLPGAETKPNGEAQCLSRVRQLTFDGRRSGEGYFSSDGEALIFQSAVMYDVDLEDLEKFKMGEGEVVDLGTFLVEG